MWILLIENEGRGGAEIVQHLEGAGDVVGYTSDWIQGMRLAVSARHDAIVLTRELVGLSGPSIALKLRETEDLGTPILMLASSAATQDKIDAFNAGCDDYMTRPINCVELRARLLALVRRATGASRVVTVGDLVLDSGRWVARRDSTPLKLSGIRFRILELLMRRSPNVVTRQEIERLIWGDDPPDTDSALRVHVFSIRRVIDGAFTTKLLHTVPGVGYRIAQLDVE